MKVHVDVHSDEITMILIETDTSATTAGKLQPAERVLAIASYFYSTSFQM